MSFCTDPHGYHEHGCPVYALERIADALEALLERAAPPPKATLTEAYNESVRWLKDHDNSTVSKVTVPRQPIDPDRPTA